MWLPRHNGIVNAVRPHLIGRCQIFLESPSQLDMARNTKCTAPRVVAVLCCPRIRREDGVKLRFIGAFIELLRRTTATQRQ
jgi:hypothetical protein